MIAFKNPTINGKAVKELYLNGSMIWHKQTIENPYLEDNLIAQWDGIWNAGLGIHDANSTIWKDLIGNYDAYLNEPTCVGKFTTNGLSCDGVHVAARSILNNCLPFNINAEIELVATFPTTLNASSNVAGFLFCGGGKGSNDPDYPYAGRNLLTYDCRRQYNRYTTYFCGAGYAMFKFQQSSISAGIHHFRYPGAAYKVPRGYDVNKRPWTDNIRATTSLANTYAGNAWSNPGDRLTFGAGQTPEGTAVLPVLNGFVIHALRWYSSPLTQAQRDKHYQADRERFGIS